MKKILFFSVLTLALILTGCGRNSVSTDPEAGQPVVEANDKASQYCLDRGGTLRQKNALEGPYKICLFKDNSFCDVQKFYDNDCREGQCLRECRAQGARNEGWYDSCTGGLIEWADCSKPEKAEETVIDAETPEAGTAAEETNTSFAEQTAAESETTKTSVELTNADSGNITLASPKIEELMSSPFEVAGRIKTTQETLIVRVKNPNGATLIKESVNIKNKGEDGWGDFSIKLHYQFAHTTEGTVGIYVLNDSGQEENLISVPVSFNY